MRSPRVLILDPKLATEILVDKFKNFHDNEFSEMIDTEVNPLFARNPFLSRGNEWKERRNEISPAFSQNRIKALFPLITDVSRRLAEFINNDISEPFEAKDLASKFTTETVSTCIFGIEANAFAKDESELRKMSKRMFNHSASTIIKVMLRVVFPPLKYFMKVKLVDDDVNAFFLDLLAQSLDYRARHKVVREDYLDYLIQLQKKKGLSNMDLAGHSITFFTDGMETSSILIAHVLYEVILFIMFHFCWLKFCFS